MYPCDSNVVLLSMPRHSTRSHRVAPAEEAVLRGEEKDALSRRRILPGGMSMNSHSAVGRRAFLARMGLLGAVFGAGALLPRSALAFTAPVTRSGTLWTRCLRCSLSSPAIP